MLTTTQNLFAVGGVKEVKKTIDANLKRAERLRQAILARAFAGKLVPQDPADEPASVLLERIRVRGVLTLGEEGTSSSGELGDAPLIRTAVCVQNGCVAALVARG